MRADERDSRSRARTCGSRPPAASYVGSGRAARAPISRKGSKHMRGFKEAVVLIVAAWAGSIHGQTVVKNEAQIDSLDPGIKLFLREKMAQGNARFANDNVLLFLHGATSPSTCDFDLQYKDYSWADWLARRGYVVFIVDYRNYGGSTREPAMDQPASQNQPVSRSYLALRDIEVAG